MNLEQLMSRPNF